eukprot:gene60-12879_t
MLSMLAMLAMLEPLQQASRKKLVVAAVSKSMLAPPPAPLRIDGLVSSPKGFPQGHWGFSGSLVKTSGPGVSPGSLVKTSGPGDSHHQLHLYFKNNKPLHLKNDDALLRALKPSKESRCDSLSALVEMALSGSHEGCQGRTSALQHTVLCASAPYFRWMHCDHAKNIPGGDYHIRKPETRELQLKCDKIMLACALMKPETRELQLKKPETRELQLKCDDTMACMSSWAEQQKLL